MGCLYFCEGINRNIRRMLINSQSRKGEEMKRNKKNKSLVTLLLVIAMSCALMFTGCGNKEAGTETGSTAKATTETKASEETAAEEISVKVVFDVSAATESEEYDVDVDLPEKEVTLEKDATAADALEATDVEFDDSQGYVTSIGGLSEKDCGEQSGWTYLVNDEMPEVGASDYVCNDGDVITWTYVLSWE